MLLLSLILDVKEKFEFVQNLTSLREKENRNTIKN